jgi:murein hydrolase activator
VPERWPRRAVVAAGLVAIGLVAPGAALAGGEHRAAADGEAGLEARGAVVARALELIAEKRAETAALAARRLRALYKATRAGHAPLWFDRAARGRLARRRAAAAVVGRDLAELAVLDGETRAARAAAARLAAARGQAPVAPPAAGSLVRPVGGAVIGRFGAYRDGPLSLTRRGVELSCVVGQPVRAPAAGRVAYLGPLRGLGLAAVLEHGGLVTVMAPLASATVAADQQVAAGATIGTAATRRLTLEVRLAGGDPAGTPIDPAPLLGR